MKAPFPYFGGKSKVADEVWQRFGQPKRYIEPFCGSAAVLLQRPGGAPSGARDEVINDFDGFITNFYRTVKQQPDELIELMDYTVSELDLHARRDWLQGVEDELIESLRADPHYCHAKAAAWWCWGVCQSIGGGWPYSDSNLSPEHSINGRGIFSTIDTEKTIHGLSHRFSKTKILFGSWERCIESWSALHINRSENAPAAVFLDPPYPNNTGSSTVYGKDSNSVAYQVEQWCRQHQDDPTLRIALCGYKGSYKLPEWNKHHWKAKGGYANQSETENENRHRETVWFSPQCRNDVQKSIFSR